MVEISTIVISAIVSFIVAFATAKVTSYSKDIINERTQWRIRIRELALETNEQMRSGSPEKDELDRIWSEFRIRLNPNDECFDNEILKTLRKASSSPDEKVRRRFLAQVARLLKHDWERAKSEASVLGIFRRPDEKKIRTLKSSDCEI